MPTNIIESSQELSDKDFFLFDNHSVTIFGYIQLWFGDIDLGVLNTDSQFGRWILPSALGALVLILALFWLREMGKFVVSGHCLENTLWREWPEIWYAAVSWPPSELIRLWLQFVDFSNFDAILTLWKGSNLGFPGMLVMLCGFSSLWWPFGWNWSYLGFLGIIWSKCRRGAEAYFRRFASSSV